MDSHKSYSYYDITAVENENGTITYIIPLPQLILHCIPIIFILLMVFFH